MLLINIRTCANHVAFCNRWHKYLAAYCGNRWFDLQIWVNTAKRVVLLLCVKTSFMHVRILNSTLQRTIDRCFWGGKTFCKVYVPYYSCPRGKLLMNTRHICPFHHELMMSFTCAHPQLPCCSKISLANCYWVCHSRYRQTCTTFLTQLGSSMPFWINEYVKTVFVDKRLDCRIYCI